MLRFLALLLLIPLLDALLLVFVATRVLNAPLTVLLVVLTALVGMLLVRAEGRHTVRKIQQKTARGELPTNELLDGAFLLFAGGLLLTPGLVTDAIGLLLVIPLTRAPVRYVVREYVVVPYMDKKSGGFATGNVYIGGFPFGEGEQGQAPGPGPGPNQGGAGPANADAYDLDDDAYDVEFEDEDERR